MADNAFILFTLGPVQGFIKAARSVRDLWSGSYLLSYLTYRAMKAIADRAGSEAIVFPALGELPLWKCAHGGQKQSILEPCIPNRFLAEVSADVAETLATRAEDECRKAWNEIATSVREFLDAKNPHPTFTAANGGLWQQQITTFFEIYTVVLPQKGCTLDRIQALLGAPPKEIWAGQHQLAQKMLAARKAIRQFPDYKPTFPSGKVPQKDTLLGSLEHMGPGDRAEANGFWEAATAKWDDRGSKVTNGERLCAVSLVKRFAWAQHFSKLFGLNPRELRYEDTATIAAKKWLHDGERLVTDRARKFDDNTAGAWSGQWLHWPTRNPPKGDDDEDMIPESVWDHIQRKKRPKDRPKDKDGQGKPPTYYAAFVFDGDNMGDRYKEADANLCRKLSKTLGNFALKEIGPIVENHHGELIYAGGDDALCLLPTETVLACAAKINEEFARNWTKGLQVKEPATISGGLVIAHYKEDLRFVLEEARKAEKAAKEAGRNALQIRVCRRSGEHTSAIVPWGFLAAVQKWVAGFMKKASDRWVYKLRGDLPVLAREKSMFKLELGRQLGRAEGETRKLLPVTEIQEDFDKYLGTTEDFVTLLQTASFLARGRDQ
jgi:CRISPR-associated protein Cmr2